MPCVLVSCGSTLLCFGPVNFSANGSTDCNPQLLIQAAGAAIAGQKPGLAAVPPPLPARLAEAAPEALPAAEAATGGALPTAHPSCASGAPRALSAGAQDSASVREPENGQVHPCPCTIA